MPNVNLSEVNTMNEQLIDNFASDSNLAVNHTICHALYNGETVQYLENGKWYDYPRRGSELFGPWCYRKDMVSWRVKPEGVEISYRVALLKDYFGQYFTYTADNYDNSCTEANVEKRDDFIKWLGDTVTAKVEV